MNGDAKDLKSCFIATLAITSKNRGSSALNCTGLFKVPLSIKPETQHSNGFLKELLGRLTLTLAFITKTGALDVAGAVEMAPAIQVALHSAGRRGRPRDEFRGPA